MSTIKSVIFSSCTFSTVVTILPFCLSFFLVLGQWQRLFYESSDCQIVLCQLSSSWDPVSEFLSPPNRHIRLPPEGFSEEVCGCVSTEDILVQGFICKLPECFLSPNQGPATELTYIDRSLAFFFQLNRAAWLVSSMNIDSSLNCLFASSLLCEI